MLNITRIAIAMPPIHLMLVDSGQPCLSFIKNSLPKEVYSISSFNNAESLLIHALRNCTADQKYRYRCALLNHRPDVMSGLEAQKHLRNMYPSFVSIIYSVEPTPKCVIEAWRSGADDYLIYPFDGNELHTSLHRILSAREQCGELDRHHSSKGNTQLSQKLTVREREIMQLIVQGQKNTQISEHLRISLATVKMHRSNLMRKLCVHNAAQLSAYFHIHSQHNPDNAAAFLALPPPPIS